MLIYYITKTLVLWTVLLPGLLYLQRTQVSDEGICNPQLLLLRVHHFGGLIFHSKERQKKFLCRAEKWKVNVIPILEIVLIIYLYLQYRG